MRACNCARASPFQSRTCVGCDLVILYQRDVLPVVSIHAPAWGATSSSTSPMIFVALFQSTHPRGVRLRDIRISRATSDVSIHAPAWGATKRTRRRDRRRMRFNPRTRVGCDLLIRHGKHCPQGFQSTHPRGVRLPPTVCGSAPRTFQSTHPRGVRHRISFDAAGDTLFQSTHPRGVRLFGRAQHDGVLAVSIHAPAWGATHRQRP